MLEEKLLLWRLKRGDADALRHIYDTYKNDMLGLAVALSYDKAIGEDVVHDAFVSFVRFVPRLRLRTSLRSYLLTAVANRVRNLNKVGAYRAGPLIAASSVAECVTPVRTVIEGEQAVLIERAMAALPYDQREVIILHLQVGLRFREIAASQDVSINTVQSRYRYGLNKLRSMLDGKVTP